MKKFLTLIFSAAILLTVLFCGCYKPADGRDGRDGKDGQGVSVYDLYEAAKEVEGNENLSFDDFLKNYLSYSDSSLNLQASINRSLMSGVTILTRFSYTTKRPSSIPGLSSNRTSYKVFNGSGAIIWLDKTAGDAYVVTNCHVIYDDTADDIFCTDVRLYLYGQDTTGNNYVIDTNYDIKSDENYRIEAEVIGACVQYDIALLKVTDSEVLRRSDAVAANFSDKDEIYVGEYVYTIGNASGEGMSASEGIISKDSEEISLSLSDADSNDLTTYRVMRTTAPINHGNSGGALYNTSGEIVGIVNAKDEGEDIDNMGYALPASSTQYLLKSMYDDYVSNGYKMRSNGGIYKAFLNITTTVADSYARFNNSTGMAEITELIKVAEVEGFPARNSLMPNDIFKAMKIVGSDGIVKQQLTFKRQYQLSENLLQVRKGDTVTLTVERGGNDVVVIIKFNSDNYFKYFA